MHMTTKQKQLVILQNRGYSKAMTTSFGQQDLEGKKKKKERKNEGMSLVCKQTLLDSRT